MKPLLGKTSFLETLGWTSGVSLDGPLIKGINELSFERLSEGAHVIPIGYFSCLAVNETLLKTVGGDKSKCPLMGSQSFIPTQVSNSTPIHSHT